MVVEDGRPRRFGEDRLVSLFVLPQVDPSGTRTCDFPSVINFVSAADKRKQAARTHFLKKLLK